MVVDWAWYYSKHASIKEIISHFLVYIVICVISGNGYWLMLYIQLNLRNFIIAERLLAQQQIWWMVQRFYISNRFVQLTAQLIFMSSNFQLICFNLLVFTFYWLGILEDSSETLSAGKLCGEKLYNVFVRRERGRKNYFLSIISFVC